MKNKLIFTLFTASSLMISTTFCNSLIFAAEEEWERDIDILLDAYDVVGGMLKVTESNSDINEYSGIGILGFEGETIKDALDYFEYSAIEPFNENDEFEGWAEYAEVISEDSDFSYEFVSEKLYTTEELLELVVPDHAINYVAKWASIPFEEYFTAEAWDDSTSSGAFAFVANGGIMTFYESEDIQYECYAYTYWLNENQALNEIMGTEYYAAFISIEKEDDEFLGWTLYEADDAFWSDEISEEEDLSFLPYSDEDGYEDVRYIVLRNAEITEENAPTEKLCALAVEEEKCYLAVANWASEAETE